MAEPLLRRTFSKLRAKERFRRKTDPKLTDVTGKVDLLQTPASAETESGSSEDQTRCSQITVSKKQNWAKLPTACREPDLCSSLVYGPPDWDPCSERADKQAWSQRTLSEDGLKRKRNDLELEFGYSRTACDAVDAGLPELTPPSTTYMDACVSSSSAKISGQGAYLQHLDRSSRAWVLSTGKPQTPDETLPARITEWRQGSEREGNIWYNPIPEEDDVRAGVGAAQDGYGDPWRKRDIESFAKENRELSKRTGGSAGTGTQDEADVVGADSSDVVLPSDSVISAAVSDSPGTQKKAPAESSSSSSVMDRIKSPGTVRRLSMKMKKLPELRRKLSLRSSRNQQRHGASASSSSSTHTPSDDASPTNTRKESSNVISRYHLDSSAPARPTRRSSRSASKGGYLSDGDSPELLPKGQGSPTAQESLSVADAESFRLYSLADQPRCAQRLSGLLTVHLLGVEELLRANTASKEVFCAIQVDGVTRARTSLLTCRGACLPLNHTFNLELERARLLKLVILTPASANASGAPARNRVCCVGAVAIPALFKASRSQHLCVRLEPRGLLYVKLTLLEQFVSPFPRPGDLPPPAVFGVELRPLVEKENTALRVPLIIQKCVSEIQRRGLRVVGLYRLCGSAAVKKELRDAFERDSAAVTLNDELYPDVNVITGILKDYLRELPSPLITRTLYEVVLEAMTLRPAYRNDSDAQKSQSTVSLLQCLAEPERATLCFLLDHLSLVASYSDSNRMTCQNLAVCFGPVLLTPSQECWQAGLSAPVCGGVLPGSGSARGGRSFAHSEEINSAVDFKRHIEALHYLLQLWPVPTDGVLEDRDQPQASHNPSVRLYQRAPLHVDLPPAQEVVVSRRGRGRLESPPCNRYAGDWSVCGRDFLSNDEADYDEVAGSESDEEKKQDAWTTADGLYMDDFTLDFDAPFTCRLSLKDFDTLISDLERELATQINICL